MRAAADAAALGAGAGVLLAAGTRAAGLTRADPVIDLTFMPWWVHWDPAGVQLLKEATAQFSATPGRRGLRLTALQGPQGGSATTSGVIADILAGQGPDVVGDCCAAWVQYLGVGAFENLTPYMRRDDVPASLWSAGHMRALSTEHGQMGLPIYDGPMVFAYRQDILDELGLAYPDPDWTWKDAEKIWRQCAGTVPGTTRHRYGAGFSWGTTDNPSLILGFGGAVMDANRTRCLLDRPQAIAAGEWIMPLFWENVVEGYADDLQTGTVVFQMRGGWDVHNDAVNFGLKFKWDYLPVPRYPHGRATFANNDFWGMNAYGRHKDAAWEVLKWLTAEDYWQEFVMKATLLEPCKLSLWDKWEYYWTQAAPVFRTKQIRWYKDAALGGYAYPEEFFRYEAAEADNVLSTMMQGLNARKTSVAAGFTRAAKQVDALEASGPAIVAAQEAQLARARAYVDEARASGGAIAFPRPPRFAVGSGTAPADAGLRVAVTAGGTVRVLVQGGAVQGRADNCVFAGSAFTPSRGEVRCRLLSVALPRGGALSNFPTAKVGLMARSSLGSQAAAVAVFFAANRGLHAFGRPLDGFGLGDERSGASPGLLGQASVQVPRTPPAGGNWLLRPVWFRLTVDANVWTPYTSLDGRTWSVAGRPQWVEFVGAWVGVFATSASETQALEAVFDSAAGFQPDTRVVVGSL